MNQPWMQTQFPMMVFIVKVFGTQWSVNDFLVLQDAFDKFDEFHTKLYRSLALGKNGWELGATLTVNALWLHNLLLGTCSCTIVLLWLSLRVTMRDTKQKGHLWHFIMPFLHSKRDKVILHYTPSCFFRSVSKMFYYFCVLNQHPMPFNTLIFWVMWILLNLIYLYIWKCLLLIKNFGNKCHLVNFLYKINAVLCCLMVL